MSRAATRDQEIADRVAVALRRWRLGVGMSQAELARRLGVDHTTVCRWEGGARTPSVPQLVALCQVTGVSIDVLVGLRGEAA